MGVHWKDWCWSWNSNTLATWWEELTHWKRPWCWEGLEAGGEGDNRGWDGWMASPTWWTWVSVNSGSWWWTGRPGMLQFMRSQRVGHDWSTELNWRDPVAGKTSFLGIFMRMLLEEINIWFSRLSRDSLSPVWISIIQSIEGLSRIKKNVEQEQILSLFFSWNIHLLLPSDIKAPGSWAFRLRLTLVINPNPHFLGFSDVWTWPELLCHQLSWFFSWQAADCRTSLLHNLWTGSCT